jgi:RNA polymerase sigma factor (sigma-70 family)
MTEIIQHVRRAVLLSDGAGLTDGQLLECFLSRREEAALAALVRRHSPMVWGVCRRVLFNHHDAEDAFQATFLVLVRRASSIMPRDMVANWLYGVAYQTALKARGMVARRTTRERQVDVMPEFESEAFKQHTWNDLRHLLDQELSSLPDKHRAVIVLCDLEEKTRREAARQLGVPEGTVASRLATARRMLGSRLARHGVALSGGTLAAVLSQGVASASVPSGVVSATVKVATLSAAGQATGGLISARVAALMEAVLKTLFLTKRSATTAFLLAVGLIGASAGTLGWPYVQATHKHAKQDAPSLQQEEALIMDNPENLDPLFRTAVSAIDAGDVSALERLLAVHPRLLRERLDSPGDWLRAMVGNALEGYFRQPYLLWFVAENPVRNNKLRKNIAQVTRTIIQAGQRERVDSLSDQLNYTLGLVSTGRVARQCGVQRELINVLIDAGATRPEELRRNEPLLWSPGTGTDVWDMFRAASTGDLATVKRLLDKDPSLVRCHHEYRTPIYFAVRENQVEVAGFLLEHGADPLSLAVNDSLLDICRDRGYTAMQNLLEAHLAQVQGASPKGEALAAAIRERDLEKLQSLVDTSPELLRAGDARGNQPIHWAVMTRQLDMIDELLGRGADINAVRFDGARPIQLTNGDYDYRGWRDVPKDTVTTPRDVLNHLRARGAYCDICTAAYIGDLERVRELVAEDPSLANRPSDYVTYYACSGTPLRNAAAGGHIEIVKLLLEHGADPNLPEEGIAPRGHALHSAVCNGHIEIVKLLLDKGAYPNVEIESSADTLSAAIARSNQPMIDLLCSYGAARPVHLLAHYGDLETAAAVFAANPALADDLAALGSAASLEPFVRLMLRYQPDLPKRASIGAPKREVTELLFRHGMDPNRPNWLGITPLHRFAKSGDVENAAIFIDHGADLHARDEDIRSTPLGWAAKFGKIRMVELLLRRGAKLNLPDDPPWATPLAWATRRGHSQIVELLKKYEKEGALPEG